jgi:hypothetical protein
MDSTDDETHPLLNVTGIGRTEAEPVLVDATRSQRVRVAFARPLARRAGRAAHSRDVSRRRRYKEGNGLLWAGPMGRRRKRAGEN